MLLPLKGDATDVLLHNKPIELRFLHARHLEDIHSQIVLSFALRLNTFVLHSKGLYFEGPNILQMVTLEKIARLAQESRFDSLGPAVSVDPEKLSALGEGTRYDVCASTHSPRSPNLPGICHSFTHDGRCVSLFKTLYTNYCGHQCNYCTNAANCSRRTAIFSYTPQELVSITLSMYRANYIEGLFLSSGSGRNEDHIMEKMLETARMLRQKHGFQGYIHLKVLLAPRALTFRRPWEWQTGSA
jgi:hypothetical protein